jgi:hypothetical protein
MHYGALFDQDKERKAVLTSDLCTITHDDQVDRFIRVVLEIPIHGVTEPFMWGVWVSLSADSFERYTSSWEEHDESDSYFGWFSNVLPYYPETINLKANVRPRLGGLRPYLELQEVNHPLFQHFRDGLTIQDAQRVAEVAMHGAN